jgi:outer membrane protein assembly factor BamB
MKDTGGPARGGRTTLFQTAAALLALFSLAFVQARGQISLSKPLSVKWQYDSGETLGLSPTVFKEAIILPLSGGRLVSLRLQDGRLNWTAELGGEITASPASDERYVYAASAPQAETGIDPGHTVLRAVGINTGVTAWARPLPSILIGELASSDSTIFARGADGRLYAVRKRDGQTLWESRNERAYTRFSLARGGRIYAGGSDGGVYCIEQSSGKVVRRYQVGGPVNVAPVVYGQTLFVASTDNYVYAVSLEAGRRLWRRRTGGNTQSLVTAQGGLLLTSLDNFAYLFDARDGGLVWKRQLGSRVAAPPATTVREALFAPLAGDECVVLDLESGRKTNGIFVGDDNNTSAAPLVVGPFLFITTRKGLLALTETSGPGTDGTSAVVNK